MDKCLPYLSKYNKCDRIADFEEVGRVIALSDMPKIEGILGIPAGVLN